MRLQVANVISALTLSNSQDSINFYKEQVGPRVDGSPQQLPFEPRRVAGISAKEFTRFVIDGVPVIITDGLKGTGMDVIQHPDAWTCQSIAQRFPKARMKREYTQDESEHSPDDNPIKMREFLQEMEMKVPSGAADPNAPKWAPLYWGVKGGDEGEVLWDGGKNLLTEVQKLMRPLPKFLSTSGDNMHEILGSPEFWFAMPGAGAKAHMDAHCQSTLTLQLDGTKRWRLSWPPAVPEGHFAPEGTYGDGQPYKAVGGWQPAFSFNLSKGEVLLIPPAFIHESLNVQARGCSPSLTFQFANPPASGMFRRLLPRMRRTGDFNECWNEISQYAAFGSPAQQLKSWGLPSPAALAKRPAQDISSLLTSTDNAWAKLLKQYDQSGDGKLTSEDQVPIGSLGFHDMDGDGEITQTEFSLGITHWLGIEASVLRERKQKPKRLKRLEL